MSDGWRTVYAQLQKRLQQMQQMLDRVQSEARFQRERNAAAREEFRRIRVERRKTSR